MPNDATSKRPYWLPDTQGFLAIGILLFVFLAFLVLIFGPKDLKGEILSVVTVVIGVLTGSLKDVYTYYFPGSQDLSGNSDAIRKIAMEPSPPAPGTVAPWWPRLTETEKSVIGANAKDDPRINAIAQAMATGAATADDLAYLASKGVLTQQRADAIKA